MLFFSIQKSNLVAIQSSRFRWYSFVFERTQSRLVVLLAHFTCDLMTTITGYDFLEVKRVIFNNFEPTPTLPNFTLGQLFMWIGANNDHIWLPMDYKSDSEQCSNWLQLYLISLFVKLYVNWGKYWSDMTLHGLDDWFLAMSV